MVIRANGYYEAKIRYTFIPERPVALMLKGICRAFMDLGHGKPYPDGIGTFRCEQTKAIVSSGYLLLASSPEYYQVAVNGARGDLMRIRIAVPSPEWLSIFIVKASPYMSLKRL